jgi:hypothetical protein
MLQDLGADKRDLTKIACECVDCIQLVSGSEPMVWYFVYNNDFQVA